METATSLNHSPAGAWQFDSSVTECFEDMLRRSIPQYDVMRESVHRVARRFVSGGGGVIDLGCSRGDALRRLVDETGDRCRYIGVDVSEPMLDVARASFALEPHVQISKMDLRFAYPELVASVTLSVLCLQFIPINYRQAIVQRAYEHTRPGGAFILVEKVLGGSADIESLMVDTYHGMKAENGYSAEQIDRKRLALEGVLVPVTAHWNEELLRTAGFRQIDCFWRWMNFAAWLAIK